MSDTDTTKAAAASPDAAPPPEREMVSLPPIEPAAVPDWIAAAKRPATAGESPIFDRMVQTDDDLVGLLAFALCEQDRRDWLAAWQTSHPSPPTADQMEAYIAGRNTPSQIEQYRAGSRRALEAYALAAVEYERPLIAEEAVTARIERAARAVEAGGRWWRQIGGALVAIIVLAVVLALVAVGLHYLGIDLVALVRQYFPDRV